MSETLNLARYKKGSDVFEIVVNPDKAMHCRRHPTADVRDALVYPKIFSDAKKGLLASEQKMAAIFGTTDPIEVAKIIIEKGDVQVNAEFRAQQQEQKRRRIIDILQKQGVDPRTNAPHPLTRIENAMAEAKVRIDEYEQAELQVPAILKQLQPIMPIKLVKKELQVNIPAEHAGKAFPIVKGFGKVLKEAWLNDGSWSGKVEIPGGMETEFYDKLNSATRGSAEITLISTKGEE